MSDADDVESGDGEKPPIEQDELVELDDELLGEVQAAAGDATDDGGNENPDEEGNASTDATGGAELEEGEPGPTGVNIGDVYVRGVSTAGASLIERYSEEEIDRDAKISEFQALAGDLWLDHYFSEWWRTQIASEEEIPPGQMVVSMTALLLAFVALDEPAVIDGLMDDLAGGEGAL